MGIEDLVNQVTGQGADPAHINKLAGPLSDMLGGGGVTDMLGKLTGGGFADTVKSWVGTGANLPISADSLSSVLGSGFIGSLAAKVGLTHSQTAVALSEILPKVIDHMTPTGHPPAADAPAPSPTDILSKMFS
jgi:uncharacterized protein YidB (DUF937 family)